VLSGQVPAFPIHVTICYNEWIREPNNDDCSGIFSAPQLKTAPKFLDIDELMSMDSDPISIEHTTRILTRISSPLLDTMLKFLASRRSVQLLLGWNEARRFGKIHHPRSTLIISDINIGDAVIVQSFIGLLKKSFPEIEIDFVYQNKAWPLIKANPHVTGHHPLFQGTGIPNSKDFNSVRQLVGNHRFDVIFNLCPYFSSGLFKHSDSVIFHSLSLIFRIMSSHVGRKDRSHYAYQLNEFSRDVIRNLDMNGLKRQSWDGETPIPHLFLHPQTFLELSRTLNLLDISQDDRVLFLNPDASSPYTCIPVDFQVDLLTNILPHPNLDRVLMNCGFTFQGIEKKILDQIPDSLQRKITILPKDTRIDVYAALTDRSDMFISADTGPMHIAAAKKISHQAGLKWRNTTAVVGIFGATSGQIYGYDSTAPRYLGSPQNAPSKIFESQPRCKNLTCIDKVFKNCRDVLCFDGLCAEPIIEYVHAYFN